MSRIKDARMRKTVRVPAKLTAQEFMLNHFYKPPINPWRLVALILYSLLHKPWRRREGWMLDFRLATPELVGGSPITGEYSHPSPMEIECRIFWRERLW